MAPAREYFEHAELHALRALLGDAGIVHVKDGARVRFSALGQENPSRDVDPRFGQKLQFFDAVALAFRCDEPAKAERPGRGLIAGAIL